MKPNDLLFDDQSKPFNSQQSVSQCILGVGFFQQSAPELVALVRVQEDELAVAGGQAVVDDHIHPASVLPEPEPTNRYVYAKPKQLLGKGIDGYSSEIYLKWKMPA